MRQDRCLHELIEFAYALDNHKKLFLCDLKEVNERLAYRIIPVYKSGTKDRIVWDRRLMNGYKHQLKGASQPRAARVRAERGVPCQ